HLDDAAGDLRLGADPARPPVPLAALLQRGGVLLVHPAPDPDRAAGVLAGARAARRNGGSRHGRRRNRRGLPAVARILYPQDPLAAPAVRTQGDAACRGPAPTSATGFLSPCSKRPYRAA